MDSGNFVKISDWLSKKANELFRKHYFPRWMVFVMDSVLVFVTFILAYLLRFNFIASDFNQTIVYQQGILVLTIYAVFTLIFRSYTGLIRHTTVIDIFTILMSTSSSLIALLIISFVSRYFLWDMRLTISASIILIHFVLITMLLIFIRIAIKIFYQLITSSFIQKNKVLIFGAGATGVIVKRVIQSDVKATYQIAGFLDNNKQLQGKKLNGIPVYNPDIIYTDFIRKNRIEILIFAIKDIVPSEKSEIIRTALDVGLEVRDTPPVDNWLNGQLQMRQIQKVQLKDLLGREPIVLNLKRIGEGLKRKTILVTGAAGSIGSEIVRQLTKFDIKNVILVDQAETPMFNLETELRSKDCQFSADFILTDITNNDKMEKVFQEFHPDIVFHAAAYKHVPLMENNPHEAIRVNIGSTRLITQLSVRYGVEKFVMISTDKAVNPTNVMGASKRICEMIVQMKAQQTGNKTQFVITRFGNVLGSNGSVIPIFRKQIEDGGPITVTHQEVTRYFMTIPEACELVLEAGFMGKGGEIFVFDMGNPVKIKDLANQMIRLSGLVPEKDIKVVFTGLRPGEKLYEELLTNNENTLPTHHPKIKIAQIENVDNKAILSKIDTLFKNLYNLSKHEVVEYVQEIVPEFKSNNNFYNQKKPQKKKPETTKIEESQPIQNPIE